MALVPVVWGCGPVASTVPSPSTVILKPSRSASVSVPRSLDKTPDPAPDPRLATVDAAQARWETHQPATFAFTFSHFGPDGVGWDWRFRVTSLDGRTQVQWLSGYDVQPPSITVDGLFAMIRDGLLAKGTIRSDFDPELGYPTKISDADPSASDSDWTDTLTDFTAPTGPTTIAHTRAVLRRARAAWQRWEPTSYEYVWRRSVPGAAAVAGSAWHVIHADGRSTIRPDPASDGVVPAEQASVAATFDAIETALDAGEWVDLTVAPVSGLPTLVAIDPSPTAAGGAYWIQIAFRDTQHEAATAALQAAMERWAAAALQHFSYTWRYRGDQDPLTYRVTWDGDRSLLKRSPGTPIPEARADATPRIDDTFRMMEQVLSQGGRLTATYDAVLGYPVRVEMDPAGDMGANGTITISDFTIR
jgi:Family of unknown function (DUF6174)